MRDASRQRWQEAQRYERDYWDRRARELRSGGDQLAWYGWRAERLNERLGRIGRDAVLGGHHSVLEIGSGPVGVTSFLTADLRVAVDPLAAFYAGDSDLSEHRSPDVAYLSAMGEDLPFRNATFDLLIIENCIDHVRDTRAVMSEVARVLKPGGILYMTVNVRSPTGTLLHRLLSNLRIDAGHPHSFTEKSGRRLVSTGDFTVQTLETEDPRSARRRDLTAPDLRSRIKGLLGLTEYLMSVIATRTSEGSRS